MVLYLIYFEEDKSVSVVSGNAVSVVGSDTEPETGSLCNVGRSHRQARNQKSKARNQKKQNKSKKLPGWIQVHVHLSVNLLIVLILFLYRSKVNCQIVAVSSSAAAANSTGNHEKEGTFVQYVDCYGIRS